MGAGELIIIASRTKRLAKKVKPIPERPSTWVRFKPALCNGCWAGCCTLPVLVTSEELFHLGYLKVHEVEGPLGKVAVRLLKKGIIQSFNPRSRLFTLQQKNGTDCVFLDEDRLCTVYDRRPSICRRFPKGSARPGFCPHTPKS